MTSSLIQPRRPSEPSEAGPPGTAEPPSKRVAAGPPGTAQPPSKRVAAGPPGTGKPPSKRVAAGPPGTAEPPSKRVAAGPPGTAEPPSKRVAAGPPGTGKPPSEPLEACRPEMPGLFGNRPEPEWAKNLRRLMESREPFDSMGRKRAVEPAGKTPGKRVAAGPPGTAEPPSKRVALGPPGTGKPPSKCVEAAPPGKGKPPSEPLEACRPEMPGLFGNRPEPEWAKNLRLLMESREPFDSMGRKRAVEPAGRVSAQSERDLGGIA
ncbi:collagen alpha-1(I) chain-like [Xiphias gladius]|uniref:collagen alpha-1(I) chain-like n=1 Tax=Xiphias gladius TaxID=8245 RepID=UPI001A981B42|nr:collagen alpha-1(I) chain-like [Xiphias gladius]